MKIRNQKDFWSGVMFIAFGIFFAGFAQQYDMGTAARMGPAFFPTMLGGLLLLLGILISFEGVARAGHDGKVEPFNFKALILVLGAVIAFGLLLRPGGMVLALFVLVMVSSFASSEFRLRDAFLLWVGVTLLVLAVFIYGLGMTIPVWPAFMQS